MKTLHQYLHTFLFLIVLGTSAPNANQTNQGKSFLSSISRSVRRDPIEKNVFKVFFWASLFYIDYQYGNGAWKYLKQLNIRGFWDSEYCSWEQLAAIFWINYLAYKCGYLPI